jgi:DMSO/TMAO reductase YedYZ molybdopterin-dependent catalytic subunit
MRASMPSAVDGKATGSFVAPRLTRRAFVAGSVVAAAASTTGVVLADHVRDTPTAKRPVPEENTRFFSAQEVELAFRNYGHLAEYLDRPITPLGAHYLLIHFDVPELAAENYQVTIGGRVANPMTVSLSELQQRETVTQPVIMECAGTGRSILSPRAIYVPWFKEAIGNYEWTGTPLRPLLEEAGLLDDAVEVLFTGWDKGIDLGVEHAFERSMPVEEALRQEVMLAWAANGQPLLPQHGFPLRLLAPTWYGMMSVKFLRAITVLNEPFTGVEQQQVYRYQVKGLPEDDPGEPVRHKRVHSVLKPPGLPDLITRRRFVGPGEEVLRGMAWSHGIPITRVEVSTDGQETWHDADVQPAVGPWSWTPFSYVWQVQTMGDTEVSSRATDAEGNVQPLEPNALWTRQGMGSVGVQRIPVTVQNDVGSAGLGVPSAPRLAVPGAKVPPRPNTVIEP